MLATARKLALGFLLMAGAGAVLLVSDLGSRHREDRASPGQAFRVAVIQNVSHMVLDDGVAGVIEGLAAAGYEDGKNLKLSKFNAEGDMPTLNAIARQVVHDDFDLVVSASTPALQAVANANASTRKRHVFCLVTDPSVTGVGISKDDPLQHPPYLTGYGTLQPVQPAFEIARSLYPGLKSIGVVWNAAEANSAAQLAIARKVAKDMGITLEEASVDNSSGVGEAAGAVVSRGVDAIWMPGDSTVMVAADALIQAARKGGIPVFSVSPPTTERGALFDLGANYYEVGRQAGLLAGGILGGKDPATVPIVNYAPETFFLNTEALKGLKKPWKIPADLPAKADVLIDAAGRHNQKAAAAPPPVPVAKAAKKWKISMIAYVQVLDTEEAAAGVREGLEKQKLVAGTDYELTERNALGDMATLSGLIDAAVTDRADMIVTLSTPTLQAALRRAGNIPIVFTYCANGLTAGAGKSEADHLPNVTGVQTKGAYGDLLQVVRECLPNARTIGTLVVPSEVNMVYHRDRLAEAAKAMGIEVVSVAAETSAEVPDAAMALCQRKIDAVCQIPGNLTATAFPGIARAARVSKTPLFASQGSQARAGAPVVVARDYHDAGVDTAALIARIIRGESPASIPFETFSRNRLILNPKAAEALGMAIPQSLYGKADEILKE
jgi:ABC-type uncharacterized transport system substrate-binding protein